MNSSKFIESIHKQARLKNKCIVLPECDDDRIIKASALLVDKKLAIPYLIGEQNYLKKRFIENKITFEGVEFIDPDQYKIEFAKFLVQAYKHKKNLSKNEIEQLLQDPINLGALAVATNKVNGMVAGVNTSTAKVIKTSFRIIGLDNKYKTASSFFIMIPKAQLQEVNINKMFIFADCAVVIEPSVRELVDICLATVENSSQFLSSEPIVAMLSFSTEGSANHPKVKKIVQATAEIKKYNPQLKIIGEIQLDAALYKEVADIKLKKQKFYKPANILIFPDLNSGNISYKICQRLAGFHAIGPILQGFKLPVNDLSRGASVDDIINLVALTSLQAK